jgi:hypothetical protein
MTLAEVEELYDWYARHRGHPAARSWDLWKRYPGSAPAYPARVRPTRTFMRAGMYGPHTGSGTGSNRSE